MARELDANFLKGLKWKGATGKDVEKDGKKKTVQVPFERPLEAGDVSGFSEYSDRVVITTTDGKKHTVAKNAEKAK